MRGKPSMLLSLLDRGCAPRRARDPAGRERDWMRQAQAVGGGASLAAAPPPPPPAHRLATSTPHRLAALRTDEPLGACPRPSRPPRVV